MTDKEVEARLHKLGERSRALDALDPECKRLYEEIITLIPRVQESVGRWLDDLGCICPGCDTGRNEKCPWSGNSGGAHSNKNSITF